MDFEDQQHRMEKMRGRKNTKISLCIPRLGGKNNNSSSSSSNNNNNWLSPISLLERFREAVFRLIMLSALSKVTHHEEPTGPQRPNYYYKYPPDHHHSEAVADCIEFIKKSASTDETSDSMDSSSTDHETEQAVSAWPVM